MDKVKFSVVDLNERNIVCIGRFALEIYWNGFVSRFSVYTWLNRANLSVIHLWLRHALKQVSQSNHLLYTNAHESTLLLLLFVPAPLLLRKTFYVLLYSAFINRIHTCICQLIYLTLLQNIIHLFIQIV